MFELVCMCGRLDIAKWMVFTLNLTPEDVGCDRDNYFYNDPFKRACENGHFEVVKWLATTFEMTREDIRNESDYALRKAVKNDHLRQSRRIERSSIRNCKVDDR